MNDLAPHAAIVSVVWEIHEKMPNGMISGHSKAQGRKMIQLNGQDLALCRARVRDFETLLTTEHMNDVR